MPLRVRRPFSFCFALFVAVALIGPALTPARATADERRHALSLVGPPAYEQGFRHFGWVNPNAPKAGTMRLRAIGTFDTFNANAPKGLAADGVSLLDATLMLPSLDEPSTDYGLVAAWVAYPPDVSSATFGLRPEARFNDGQPITPEDVVFSLDAMKKANPGHALYFKNVVRAEVAGPHEVRFVFDAPGNRELPTIVGTLPVLSRHFWQGKDATGQPRDLARASLEPPVGAGPYRIKSFDAGRQVVFERVKDWWAKDLAVTRGQYNFDDLVYVYYRDRLPAFEGFKVGETDFWPENSAKGWATGFDFDAVKRGMVKRKEVADGGIEWMQGFAFNLRHPQFQDRRVRQAFNLAFNFEWANKAMFFEQYRRSSSYFGNSELACRGLPEGRERDFLEQVRAGIPPEVLTTEYKNPVNAVPADFRHHLHEAARLLSAAGFEMKNGQRENAAGVRLSAEVLLVQPNFERLVLAYKAELAKIGIDITVRLVDSALYVRRVRDFDFDIIVTGFPQSYSPGNEQREFWGSRAAAEKGSRNLIGIASPAVDALIERVIYAHDRTELVAATRALDRVLLWEYYLVPQFHVPFHRIAWWDKFRHPEVLPKHGSPLDTLVRTWWFDEPAATRLAAARKG